MVRMLALSIVFALAGCASPTQPSEPLETGSQAVGYELQDGTTVHWGDVRTGGGTNDSPSNRDYSDRSTAR